MTTREGTTEAELFAGYRHPAGFSAQCACGSWIDAPTDEVVPAAVDVHNASTEHQQWRAEQAALEARHRIAARAVA